MLNFAILGCGRIAQRHAKHITNTGRLVAVCDIVPEKANALAEEYGVPAFDSLQAMLGAGLALDVVAVCTPNGLHAEHSIAVLDAGIHALCEKPMALSVADCGAMIQASERANRRLFVIKQNRYNPPVAAIKSALDEGKLGKVLSVQLSCFWNRNENYYQNSWKGTVDLDGGTLFTQFSHFVDLLYWMVGDVESVHSFGANFIHRDIVEFEDTGVVALRFSSGALGTINYTVNSYNQNMEGSLTLFCEKGTVKIGGQYLNVLEYQNIEGMEIVDLPAGNAANNYGEYQGSMSNHDLVYRNVSEVLENSGTVTTNSYEGLKTVDIIEKIYAAMGPRFL